MSLVSLVGAGPGLASLVSIKALDRIKKADVILFDNLIPLSLLNEARLECELIYVGKNASKHSLNQEEINKLLVELSKKYEYIIRLKGGDPYIFARGAEEAIYLKNNNVNFEIISGITSAIAAPASLGIPITYRNLNSSFYVVTATESSDRSFNRIDYELLSRLDTTLIFMMSIFNIDKIVEGLLKAGKNPESFVSIISRGTYADQKRYNFTLASLNDILKNNINFCDKIKRPALLIVGDVAGLDLQAIDENTRLINKRILIPGTRQFCKKLSKKLEEKNIESINLSIIECIRENEEKFSLYIDKITNYTHIIFTSSNGVKHFFEYIKEKEIDLRCLLKLKFIVIGPGTEEALKKYGIIADFVPSKYTTYDLANEIIKNIDKSSKLILFRSSDSAKDILKIFSENSISYTDVSLYRTIVDYRRRDILNKAVNEADYIVVSSASCIKALDILIQDKKKLEKKLISIGCITTKACNELGYDVLKTAQKYSIDGIIEVLEA